MVVVKSFGNAEALVRGRTLFLTWKTIYALGYAILHLGVVAESVL